MKRKRKIPDEANLDENGGSLLSNEKEAGLTMEDAQRVNGGVSNASNLDPELQSHEEPDFYGINGFPAESNEKEGDEDYSPEPSPLGLKLKKTPSLLNLLKTSPSKIKETREISSAQENQGLRHYRPRSRRDDLGSQSEKPKASNFPALCLNIGTWQWFSVHEGDLVAKLYYAKQRIVWEILDGALKSKIEILWSDIIAIRAVMPVNEAAILEIELRQPPMFYRESNPQPKRHTNWNQVSDFTGGEATVWRRHCVRFATGVLDKHFEKLLQHDQRLFFLSQSAFPSLASPYFEPTMNGASLNFNGYGSSFHPRFLNPFQIYSTTIGYPSRLPPNPSISAMNMPYPYQNGLNQQFLAQQQTVNWVGRANFPATNLDVSAGPSHICYINPRNTTASSSQNQVLNAGVWSDTENYLMEGSLVQDMRRLLEEMDAIENNDENLSELSNQVKENGDQVINSELVNNNSTLDLQPMSWVRPEESNRNMQMEASFGYPSNGGYISNVNPNGYEHVDQTNRGFVPGVDPHQYVPRNPNNGLHFQNLDPNV